MSKRLGAATPALCTRLQPNGLCQCSFGSFDSNTPRCSWAACLLCNARGHAKSSRERRWLSGISAKLCRASREGLFVEGESGNHPCGGGAEQELPALYFRYGCGSSPNCASCGKTCPSSLVRQIEPQLRFERRVYSNEVVCRIFKCPELAIGEHSPAVPISVPGVLYSAALHPAEIGRSTDTSPLKGLANSKNGCSVDGQGHSELLRAALRHNDTLELSERKFGRQSARATVEFVDFV